MNLLEGLITNRTEIINIKEQLLKFEEKRKIIDMDSSLRGKRIEYLSMMYEKDDNWYFFKYQNKCYPYFFMNELIGSYLFNGFNLKAVEYYIARSNDKLGIACLNFKEKTSDYYYIYDLIPAYNGCTRTTEYLNKLLTYCNGRKNKEEFLKKLFYFLALEIFMMQEDRHTHNIIFKIDKETNYFDFAPFYDFSNCSDILKDNIDNAIILLNKETLNTLIKSYPIFKDILEEVFKSSLIEQVKQIANDYNFNTDCSIYNNLFDYYELKEEKIKKLELFTK